MAAASIQRGSGSSTLPGSINSTTIKRNAHQWGVRCNSSCCSCGIGRVGAPQVFVKMIGGGMAQACVAKDRPPGWRVCTTGVREFSLARCQICSPCAEVPAGAANCWALATAESRLQRVVDVHAVEAIANSTCQWCRLRKVGVLRKSLRKTGWGSLLKGRNFARAHISCNGA